MLAIQQTRARTIHEARKMYMALPGPHWLKILIVLTCIAIPGPQDELLLLLILAICRWLRSRHGHGKHRKSRRTTERPDWRRDCMGHTLEELGITRASDAGTHSDAHAGLYDVMCRTRGNAPEPGWTHIPLDVITSATYLAGIARGI